MSSRRTAIVTGASSGIGAATARTLAAHGFRVVCAARRADRVQALAEEIDGLAVTCDVTDRDSVAGLAEAAGPEVHVLVNNAGGAFGSDPVETADPAEWRAMFEVNVLGTLQVTQALLPALRASGDAVIVNVGSTAGRIAYEGGGGYTAAKHGTQVVTETLRLELYDQPLGLEHRGHGSTRCTLCWAAWASGLTTSRSMSTCGGRVTHQATQSAMSSAVSGASTPSYTLAARSASPRNRTVENSSVRTMPGAISVTRTG